MRDTLALGSAAFAAIALLAVTNMTPARRVLSDARRRGEVPPALTPTPTPRSCFYYRGYAYPYRSGLAYRERTGELLPTDVPSRERVQVTR